MNKRKTQSLPKKDQVAENGKVAYQKYETREKKQLKRKSTKRITNLTNEDKKQKKSVKNMFVNSATFLELKKRIDKKSEGKKSYLSSNDVEKKTSFTWNSSKKSDNYITKDKIERVNLNFKKAVNTARQNSKSGNTQFNGLNMFIKTKGNLKKKMTSTVEGQNDSKPMAKTTSHTKQNSLKSAKAKQNKMSLTFNDILKGQEKDKKGSSKTIKHISSSNKKRSKKFRSFKTIKNKNKDDMKKIGLGKKFSENILMKAKARQISTKTHDDKSPEKIFPKFFDKVDKPKSFAQPNLPRKSSDFTESVSRVKFFKEVLGTMKEKSARKSKIRERKNQTKNQIVQLRTIFSKNSRIKEKTLPSEKEKKKDLQIFFKKKKPNKNDSRLKLRKEKLAKASTQRSLSPAIKSSRLYLSSKYSPSNQIRKGLKSSNNSPKRENCTFETLKIIRPNYSSSVKISNFLKTKTYYMRDLKQYFKEKNTSYFGLLFNQHFDSSYRFLKLLKKFRFQNTTKKIEILPLKKEKKKLTLVLDLDETLIHCFSSQIEEYQSEIKIKQPTGAVLRAKLNYRPFLDKFFETLKSKFEFVIFTASRKHYADEILKKIDPTNEIFAHKFYREDCIQTEYGFLVKDLTIIKNRNLEEMIIVDNSTSSFVMQIQNGIPIIPFFCKRDDLELIKLRNFLLNLHAAWESGLQIPKILSDYFCFEKYGNSKNLDDLYSSLFRTS